MKFRIGIGYDLHRLGPSSSLTLGGVSIPHEKGLIGHSDGDVLSRRESCGVRLLEGRHRMAMSGFVQDARGGACSMGLPPDNLGFRLVRESPWYQRLLTPFRRLRLW